MHVFGQWFCLAFIDLYLENYLNGLQKRAPALLDNLVQALIMAPFFVLLEVIYLETHIFTYFGAIFIFGDNLLNPCFLFFRLCRTSSIMSRTLVSMLKCKQRLKLRSVNGKKRSRIWFHNILKVLFLVQFLYDVLFTKENFGFILTFIFESFYDRILYRWFNYVNRWFFF